MVTKSACVNAFLKVRYKWNEHPYFRLFAYIVATSLVLYWQFVFGDKVYVFMMGDVLSDTFHQYIPLYEFFVSSIKNGELTSYTFQNGLGNTLFSIIGHMTDPFAFIGIIVGIICGQEYVADSMIYILILKNITAGLLCLYFLKGFKLSEKSCILSSYLYAFSGFITTLGGHYFFATLPIYLILMLILIERILKNTYKLKNWILLFYFSALVVLIGVRGSYEIFLALGFYTLYRTLYISKKDIKKIFRTLGICLAFVVGGISLSLFFLMPTAEKISQSNRLAHPGGYFSLFEPSILKSNILKLFSNLLEGTPNQWYGAYGYYGYSTNCFPAFFTVLLVPFSAQYIFISIREQNNLREKIYRLLPVIVVVFAVIDQFVHCLFAFFVPSSNYYCYVYIFLPLFALMIASVFDNIKKGNFNKIVNGFALIISLGLILWGGISTYNKGGHVVLYSTLFSSVCLIVGCVSMQVLYNVAGVKNQVPINCYIKIKKEVVIILSTVIVLNVLAENYIYLNYERLPATKELEHSHMVTADAVDRANLDEGKNFFRIETNFFEGRSTWFSYPFLFPMRATGYYDTSLNNSVPDFYEKLFDSTGEAHLNNYFQCCRRIDHSLTEDLLGIKYLVSSSVINRDGWELVEKYPDYEKYLFKNNNIDSAGLLYDSYVTQEKADEMTFDERAIGLGTRLVIEDPAENIDEFALKYSEDNDFNNRYIDNNINKNSIIDIESVSPFNGTIDKVEKTDNGINVNATMLSDDSNISIPLNSDIINNSKKITQITFSLKNSGVLNTFKVTDTGEYWAEIPKVEPKIFDERETYTFIIPQTARYIALCVNQPCELDVTVSSKTVTSTYINEGIKLDNPKRGNIVTGTVNAQKNSLLYLPIPFDKYWNAYIDGEKVDIMKANYAFMAVPVTAGQHSVTFIYLNKTYHTFQKVSIAAFILYNGFFVFCLIVKYRRKKKGEKK